MEKYYINASGNLIKCSVELAKNGCYVIKGEKGVQMWLSIRHLHDTPKLAWKAFYQHHLGVVEYLIDEIVLLEEEKQQSQKHCVNSLKEIEKLKK